MPINIFIEPIEHVLLLTDGNITFDKLAEYLNGGRQDVLINPDIFCENVRSSNIGITDKNFKFFNRVESVISSSTVIIIPLYLELLEYYNVGNLISRIIFYYSNYYFNNTIIFYWNHDVDFAKYNKIVDKYDNIIILNYNTSKVNKNDIVLPFWSMDDISLLDYQKNIFCSFIGTINNDLRNKLVNNIKSLNDPNYVMGSNLTPLEFRNRLAESKYSLCPRGQGLSSYRFFECIHTLTIPILIADDVILPYYEFINYDDIIIRIVESDVDNVKKIDYILKNDKDNYSNRIEKLRILRKYFTLAGIQEYVYNILKGRGI